VAYRRCLRQDGRNGVPRISDGIGRQRTTTAKRSVVITRWCKTARYRRRLVRVLARLRVNSARLVVVVAMELRTCSHRMTNSALWLSHFLAGASLAISLRDGELCPLAANLAAQRTAHPRAAAPAGSAAARTARCARTTRAARGLARRQKRGGIIRQRCTLVAPRQWHQTQQQREHGGSGSGSIKTSGCNSKARAGGAAAACRRLRRRYITRTCGRLAAAGMALARRRQHRRRQHKRR